VTFGRLFQVDQASACLYVTRISLRAELRTFANFDLEDLHDVAALREKRYGL
jgi:hypothetical protein